MINISLAMRGNPMDIEQPKKAYASVQIKKNITLDELCKHIAQHGSIYTEDVVTGVVKKLCKCMEELIIDGNKVELGELGAFCPAISSKGAKDFASFSTATNIRAVRANFVRGKRFKDLRTSDLEVGFNVVLTKEEQAKAKKAVYGDLSKG